MICHRRTKQNSNNVQPCRPYKPILFLAVLALFFGMGQTLPTAYPAARLLQEARVLLDSARYEQALQLGQQALELGPAGEAATGDCLLLLGDIFLETGQLEAARQQYEDALTIFQQKLGSKNLSTAQAINHLGEYFYKKSDYTQAEAYYRKALQIRESALGGWHELVADGYNNLGNCRVGQGDYQAAASLHEKALAIRQYSLPANHPDLASSFNNLGNCAYYSSDYQSALRYFEKALSIREQAFGADHPKTAQVLNNIGNVYAALGQQRQAGQHYRRALDIRIRHFGPQHPTVASTLENIADLYFDSGDYIAALDYFRRAYAIQHELQGEQSVAAASLWHKIGLCYQYEGDLDRALSHHLAAAPNLLAAFGPGHPLIGGLYNNLGNCFSGKKDFSSATEYYARALRIFQATTPIQYANIALVYNNLGTIALEKNQAQEALLYFNKALASLPASPELRSAEQAVYLKNQALALESLDRWPEASRQMELAMAAAQTADPITGLELLNAWGRLLCQRGVRTNDTSLLQQSIAVLAKGRQRSDSLQVQLSNPGSNQRWLELQFPAQTSAMEAYYRLWEKTGETTLLERAFALAERNKSLQLLEHLRKEQAEQFAGIPDSLLQRERYWSETLNAREKELLAAQRNPGSARTAAAEIGVAEARQALAALIHQFEQHYPTYFQLKYDRQTATLTTIRQQVIQSDQALLEYFDCDSLLFVFVITPGDFRCLRLALHFSLRERVTDLRRSLQNYPEAGESAAAGLAQDFVEQAYSLQEAVFAPVEQAVPLPRKLLVIPDGPLAYLPFECLLRERPADAQQFKNHHYLLRDRCISYAYSATQQLALLQQPTRTDPKNLLAIAPVYGQNGFGLRPLQNNRAEAEGVCTLFDGDLREGAAA
ncbi:MAG: tetratricopeptide repeat protein, partial [Saprospiraceae bacterium]